MTTDHQPHISLEPDRWGLTKLPTTGATTGAAPAADGPHMLGSFAHDPGEVVTIGIAHVPASSADGPGDGTGLGPDTGVRAGQQGFWERHTTGDELLVVRSGRATFRAVDGDRDGSVEVGPGDVLLVKAGTAHTTHVWEPLEVVFLLPATGHETWYEQ